LSLYTQGHDVINIQHAHCGLQALTAKNSPERPLPGTGIHTRQAQACVRVRVRDSLPQPGGDVEQPQLIAKMTSPVKPEIHIITPPEEDRATAPIGNMLKKFNEARTCTSEDMTADRQTLHTQTCLSQYFALPSGRSKSEIHYRIFCQLLACSTKSPSRSFGVFNSTVRFDCYPVLRELAAY